MEILISIAIIILLYIGYTDFKNYKITNIQILSMLLLYYDQYLFLDLSVGFVLFIIGFVAWLAKGIGAGDAKLFFVAGIFSGYQYAVYFAMFLFISGLIFVFLMLVVTRINYIPIVLFGRLIEISKTKKVPYGVVLAASTIGALIVRLGAS